jgi:hypothetical protein
MNFCDVEIEDYHFRSCGIDFAGISGMGLININENPTSSQLQDYDFWIDKMDQSPLRYFILRNTRGEYLGGETIDEEDLIGTRVVGSNHSAQIDSTGLYENWQFWDLINKHLWKFVFVSSGGLMYYVDKPTSVYSKISNPKSTKAGAFYQTQLKWHDLSNPVILEAPEGLFFGINPVFDGLARFDSTLFDFSNDVLTFDYVA